MDASLLTVQPTAPEPIYRQIVDQIRHALALGTLAPGDELPGVRGVSEQLVLNPNTVARAYSELVREGLAESSPGRPLIVARRRQIYTKAERLRRIDPHVATLVNEALALDIAPAELHDLIDRRLKALGLAATPT